MLKKSSRVRLLFLLSDGKPNDLDVYEGRYGLEDTRMAIKEAEREGIIPFCLTVDKRARVSAEPLWQRELRGGIRGGQADEETAQPLCKDNTAPLRIS